MILERQIMAVQAGIKIYRGIWQMNLTYKKAGITDAPRLIGIFDHAISQVYDYKR